MGLNLSRLSRNFEEEPVIWKNHTIGFENKPTREDLYYLYKVVEDWLRRSKELNFKGKYKEFYKSAVYDWTVRDVEKRKIAKENNLNWVEFFNEEKFKEYFINGV